MFGWTKTILIVRGLPGAGKSTLALKLVGGNKLQMVENDDYWIMPNGEYHYDSRVNYPKLKLLGFSRGSEE